jgi:sugar phosphate isomerase/epimerase
MIRSAVTLSLVPEARGGPFVFWDDLAAGFASASVHGFDAVEIFPSSGNDLPVELVKELMGKYSLKVAAVGTGAGWVKHKLRLTDPDPAVRARAREFVNQVISVAAALGAPAILGSMQGRSEGSVSRDQALAWLAEALHGFGELAAKFDTCFLYEPLNRYETNLFTRAGDAAGFLRIHAIKQVKLLCDLFHMSIEESNIANALRAAGAHVGHVHFADSNRQAIGFGHTDVAPIAQALREIDFKGYVSAEILPLPDSDAAARQTAASFRHWFGKSKSSC